MARQFVWPDEAETFLRASVAEPDWRVIMAGLRKIMDPVPSREAVYWWYRRNGLTRKSSGSYGYWATPEVREWLEPRWKREGWSGPALADGVAVLTGLSLDARMVTELCAREFGARESNVTYLARGVMPDKGQVFRHRKCNRCRELKTLPQYIFTCDSCKGLAANVGAPDGYRLAGVSVR